MGAGAMKRKSIKNRLREVRAARVAPIEWSEPIPAWAMPLVTPGPPAVEILGAEGTEAQLKAITKAEYLAALNEYAPAVLEQGHADASWSAFQDRVHKRGACAPQVTAPASPKPAPPRTPAGPAIE